MWHSYPQVQSTSEMSHACFYYSDWSFTALRLVLIDHLTEGRRLSWFGTCTQQSNRRVNISQCGVLLAAITEMLPSILSQLGPESVDNLRWLASTLSKTGDDGKVPSSAAAAPIAEEDEEVPGKILGYSV